MGMIIDRFEENFAVCEKSDGLMVHIEKEKIPHNAKEGDVLLKVEGKIVIDEDETMKRKKKIEKMVEDLWE
ncbi:DUF3006 domain-containing protein [Crassaminicella profunda]|uniref:DUF3006 domain-containing protein n=1 Tax=Crassaminicella profunda TaxID=1286698 RepID=UPI001CA7599A|nr:DUF3006 domain-containing protein [Crassaminicella profunda]QZY54888.1 DUF3006 domain-containing protein [Crassaminicella profunda]